MQVDIRQKPKVVSVETQCSIMVPIVTEEAEMSSDLSSQSDIDETESLSDDLTYEPDVSDEDISDVDSEIQRLK